VAVAVFVLIFGFGLTRKPMYSAESLTYIEPLASKVLSDGTSGTYDPSRYDSYLQQQMQTAVRPDILEAAIGKLPRFVWQRPGESMQSAVARLQHSLKVERVSTSYQLSISLMDASPETAAAVVNAVTSAYLEQGRKDEHAVADQRLRLLGEERQRIEQQLTRDRTEQAQLGASLGVANPTGLGNQYDAQVAGVQTQVAGAREAHDLAAAQLASLQGASGGLSPGLAAAADEQIAADSGLNSMKGTINQRKAVLSTQMAGLTPSNPIYKQDQEEIADLDRSLEAMTAQVREKAERRLQDKMRADLQRTADFEGRLQSQLARQTATATSAAPKLQRAAELSADIDRLNARYSVVDDSMRGLELESNGPGSAHLSVAAMVPVSPEPSKRKLILLMALPLALISGILAAGIAHRSDPRVYSGPDVERVLGFLPIGVMPAKSEVSERVMEEYALRLAAGLQSAYRVSAAQSFVFTAASSGIETSGFVRAIDDRLRLLGFKALILDAPTILRAAPRNESGLRVAAGHRSGEMVRVLEGVRQGYAAQEIDRLKHEFDLVLIDAPPLLNSAETEYLVRCADATILVAESGVTLKSELYQSAVLLQQLNVAGVGAVLQELHLKEADPAFQAAIAAVERIQRSRLDGNATRMRPADRAAADVWAAETETDEHVRAVAPVDWAEQASATESAEESVTPEANASYPVVESGFQVPAEPVNEKVGHSVANSAREADLSAREVSAMSPFAWPWQKQAQRTEPEEMPAPEAVPEASGVSPASFSGRSPEPVLFFEDRMRPRREPEQRVDASSSASMTNSISEELVERMAAPWHRGEAPFAAGDEPASVAPAYPAPADKSMARAEWSVAEDLAEDERAPAMVQPVVVEEMFKTQPELDNVSARDPVEEVAFAVEGEAVAAQDVQQEILAEPELAVEAPLPETPTAAPATLVSPEDSAEEHTAAAPVANEEKSAGAPPVTRLIPRREPAAPKMEWVTLRFRGTTERVLRIVPAEDDAEGSEYEGELEEERQSFAEAVTPAKAGEEMAGLTSNETKPFRPLDEAEVLVEHAMVETEVLPATLRVEETSEPEAHFEAPEVGGELLRDEWKNSVSGAAPSGDEEISATVGRHESQSRALEEADGLAPEVSAEEHFAGEGLTRENSFEVQRLTERIPEEASGSSPESVFEESAPVFTQEILPQFDPSAASAESPLLDADEAVAEAEDETIRAASLLYMETAEVSKAPAPQVAEAEVEAPARVLVESQELREMQGAPVTANRIRLPVPISAWRQEEVESAAILERAVPAAVEHLSPVLLVSELRSRSAGPVPRSYTEPSPSGSRRSAGAPVEERLTPRTAHLTRRWEMLSRFDNMERAASKAASETSSEAEVATVGEGAREADGR
jgi:uncharacterized protein involved in exopolysaccharide biosynthesis